MSDSEKEEGWGKVCVAARQKHARYLETLRPIEHRSILQPDGVLYCVVTAEQWVEIPYTLERREQLNRKNLIDAENWNAWGTGMTVLGVSPERQADTIEFRPALITFVSGLGIYKSCWFQIVQRVELEPGQVVAYGPLSCVANESLGGEWMPDSECELVWPRVVWILDGSSE